MSRGQTTKYFQDDHGRTLRVVVEDNQCVSLAIIDNKSGNAIYLKNHPNPTRGNGIEACSALDHLKAAAHRCPLYVENQ